MLRGWRGGPWAWLRVRWEGAFMQGAWGSHWLLPAPFHPTAAWMTFPGESGVAVGGSTDARTVTQFTGPSPGHLLPPLTGHQGPLPPRLTIWGPGQQERGLPQPRGADGASEEASAHQTLMMTRGRSCKMAPGTVGRCSQVPGEHLSWFGGLQPSVPH